VLSRLNNRKASGELVPSSGLSGPKEPAPDVFRRRGRLDIQVGLDFGTSSTKAIFREIGTSTDVRHVVDFGQSSREYPSFCSPSMGVIDKDRKLLWGWGAAATPEFEAIWGGIRRLKVVVAGRVEERFLDVSLARDFDEYLWSHRIDPSEYHPEYVGAAALAYQMEAVRSQLQRRYGSTQLDVRYNVCAPIEHIEHNPLLTTYCRMCHVAEQLLGIRDLQTLAVDALLDLIAAKYGSASPSERPDGRVFVIPESVAQVACYVSSLEAKEGLHGVIDIGAGTTDIGIFNLRKSAEEGSLCYWYSAANIPLGSGLVERRVADHLLSGWSEESPPLARMSLIDSLFGEPSLEISKIVAASLEAIERATRPVWVKAYNKYKLQSSWHGIPVFLVGGGSRIRGSQRIFSTSWAPRQIEAHAIRGLPTPRQIDLQSGVDFGRLGVAYGLSYAKPELAEFRLPMDSPNQTPATRRRPLSLPGRWEAVVDVGIDEPHSCRCGGTNEECTKCAGTGWIEPSKLAQYPKTPKTTPGNSPESLDPFVAFQMGVGPVAASRPGAGSKSGPRVSCFCGRKVTESILYRHLQSTHGLSDREASRTAEILLRNPRTRAPEPVHKRSHGAGTHGQTVPKSQQRARSRKNQDKGQRNTTRQTNHGPRLVTLARSKKCSGCGQGTTTGRPMFGGSTTLPMCRRCNDRI
jgi:hypothetical protein